MVIFGITGDLTHRLLLPALSNLALEKLLPRDFAIVGLAHNDVSEDALRGRMREALQNTSNGRTANAASIDGLTSRLHYVRSEFTDPAGFNRLAEVLRQVDRDYHTQGNYLFYLATAPDFFKEIAQRLSESGLLRQTNGQWRRLVVEKPFGHDVESARQLNADLTQLVEESQIYRIDHYLGKETVQNILVFRFANGIFEPIWNRRYIDHVQITVAETVGVGTRAGYYDHSGALRDMVPNHLMQLLSLTAMEPPISFSPSALHNEQVKVLQAVPPVRPEECSLCSVRGQYSSGMLEGKPAPGYRGEKGVAPNSQTETFVALKLAVDNWRWAGIPFYIRTGKRLAAFHTEISIQFRQAPLGLFRSVSVTLPEANRLMIYIQPEESIALEFAAKVPGPTVTIGPVAMRFQYRDYFGREVRTGYETLLYDAMIGDGSLFKRGDMIEAAWSIVEPVLHAWQAGIGKLESYAAGSDGPEAAHDLLRRDGREWRPLR